MLFCLFGFGALVGGGGTIVGPSPYFMLGKQATCTKKEFPGKGPRIVAGTTPPAFTLLRKAFGVLFAQEQQG
eukprot:4758257-Amphidinium_carterae.1